MHQKPSLLYTDYMQSLYNQYICMVNGLDQFLTSVTITVTNILIVDHCQLVNRRISTISYHYQPLTCRGTHLPSLLSIIHHDHQPLFTIIGYFTITSLTIINNHYITIIINHHHELMNHHCQLSLTIISPHEY